MVMSTGVLQLGAAADPPTPKVEPVSVSRLPLPPTAPITTAPTATSGGPGTSPGTCTAAINPARTGCLNPGLNGVIQDGTRTFTWDGSSVFVGVTFAGAPPAPDPASIYSGPQLLLVKTDGTTFGNGDRWKCLTCNGVPVTGTINYPEAFRDEKRVKFGNNILDCTPYRLIDAACTPQTADIYPIQSPLPPASSIGFSLLQMRETRLHPDDVHLGFNVLYGKFTATGLSAGEYGALGHLNFVEATSSDPAHYALSNVSLMLSPDLDKSGRFISVKKPGELSFDDPAGVIGEFRGFTSDGKATLGIGTQDSFNFDIFATDLKTGKSTRLTRDPAYTDPVHMSPDDKSLVLNDGRTDNWTGQPDGYPQGESGRTYFASGLPGVPPLVDLAGTGIGNYYNNGDRRFFEPYLINFTGKYKNGDRDSNGPDGDQRYRSIHDGQPLNVGGDPTPGSGSISDPLWNSGADPAWKPDGTAIVYYQKLVAPPACEDPTPPEPTCPTSGESGGRYSRLLIARLTDRKPSKVPPQPKPISDEVPWGIPYTGGPLPARPTVPPGTYVLNGKGRGYADVVITDAASPLLGTDNDSVTVTYHNYTADRVNFINGTESSSQLPAGLTFHRNLTLTGEHTGTQVTSEPSGFVITPSGSRIGTLVTTLDGKIFRSPVTGS